VMKCKATRRVNHIAAHLQISTTVANENNTTFMSPSSTTLQQDVFGASHKNLLVEKRHDNIALVILNRPKVLNALNTELVEELVSVLRALDTNEQIRVIVITGSSKAFAAGADIREMLNKTVMQMSSPNSLVNQLAEIAHLRKPVIAAVNGYALGGGCELAMMCDIVIAGHDAKFGQPEIAIATIPGAGGTQRLVHAIGKSKTMEMILTGKPIDAYEAEKAGLVSRVVPADKTLDAAMEVAKNIAAMSQPIVLLAKHAVNKAFDLSLSDGILYERSLFHTTFATMDQKEGMGAFIAKRKPSWKDQ